MALRHKSLRVLQEGIDKLEDFNIGNVTGKHFRTWKEVPVGWMPSTLIPQYGETLELMPVYVVFSYGTPIAWKFLHWQSWEISEHTYSPTTTQHQHNVRVATKHPGFWVR